ncbi:MAG TPA: Asp-tRNA(Asn)/Glu-tRNA(Gln) amidotransferase subunit GatC [Bacteroidota bacterium]|nr:Asp-tRNA(Asn)/Glu-tRNA(Gln) amidotransferase subunit GatC [Bacteroidota bacterium]
MAISIHDVEHVASLAKLSFTAEEKRKLASELTEILAYMDQLNSLDTRNVEPLSHVIALDTVSREDELRPGLARDEALKNAPARTEKFFRVPKVIGDR